MLMQLDVELLDVGIQPVDCGFDARCRIVGGRCDCRQGDEKTADGYDFHEASGRTANDGESILATLPPIARKGCVASAMSGEIHVIREEDYLHIIFSGHFNTVAGKRVVDEMVAASRREHCAKI